MTTAREALEMAARTCETLAKESSSYPPYALGAQHCAERILALRDSLGEQNAAGQVCVSGVTGGGCFGLPTIDGDANLTSGNHPDRPVPAAPVCDSLPQEEPAARAVALQVWDEAIKTMSGLCHRAEIAYPHNSKAREVAMALKYQMRDQQFPVSVFASTLQQSAQNNEGSLPARQRVGADVASASGPSPESALNDTAKPVAWRAKITERGTRWIYYEEQPRYLEPGEVAEPLYLSAQSETAPPETAKVPDGWKLVTVEELEELTIMAAVSSADPNVEELEDILDAIGNKVEALLAAAPSMGEKP